VLVLPLDMMDIESHATATDKVMKHFGQVSPSLGFLLSPVPVMSRSVRNFCVNFSIFCRLVQSDRLAVLFIADILSYVILRLLLYT